MLPPQEVKPLLVHEDRHVRRAAIEYFRGAWIEDVELASLSLEAHRLYPDEESLSGLACCRNFALSADALQDVLQTLGTATDGNALYHLNNIIANAPIPLQRANRSTILDTRNLLPGTAATIERRLDLAQWPADRLWNDLQDFAQRSLDKQYVGDIDHAYVDTLIVALGRLDEPDADTICKELESVDEDNGWLEIFLIDLIGERRIQSAIPMLVDKYRIDTDYMLERVSRALSRIADPEAVRLIRADFPKESWGFKNYTAALLGNIKHQESEDAILALLETERDPSLRTILCIGLCELFSATGVEIVRKEIHHGYDRMVACLEETLLPVAQVLEIEIPEAEQWQAEREEREIEQSQRRDELAELGRRYAAAKAAGIDPFAHSQAESATKVKKSWTAATEVREPTTIRRDTPRVGRNDPCPCGSGRKFKKCCARKPK